jgi:hypothetical protein
MSLAAAFQINLPFQPPEIPKGFTEVFQFESNPAKTGIHCRAKEVSHESQQNDQKTEKEGRSKSRPQG